MSSREYQQQLHSRQNQHLLDTYGLRASLSSFTEGEIQSVDHAVALGERLLKWIDHINSFRSEENKIRLTTKAGGLRGIPIETPKRYSPRSVQVAHLLNLESLDSESKKVLVGGELFLQNPPVSDEDFIVFARKIDGNYQTAARWKMMSPWLSYYAARYPQDVRGYYYLTRTPDVDAVLTNFKTLSLEEQNKFTGYLSSLCMNSRTDEERCQGDLELYKERNLVRDFYTKYYEAGRSNWQKFFAIQNARRDINWTPRNLNEARMPFRKHSNDAYTEFVRFNVEDEFRWKEFKLLFSLKASNDRASIPYVQFEAGATPHVNGLGGNQIVMDANAPLTEWDVQWTIRHEFGHVLGLPDCYFEFYDTRAEEMVNYQLDTSDLMCSRAGKMNQRIFDELKRVYF